MAVNTNFLANPGWAIANGSQQALTLGIAPVKDQNNNFVGWNSINFDDPATKDFDTISPGVLLDPVQSFKRFVNKNPIHIAKFNIRASDAVYLPTSIIISTPNFFTGQYDRQIINVTADTTMYQNQNNMVTINGLDILVGRQSVIQFDAAFSTATQPSLSVDVTIDKYISLEKALYMNMQQLATAGGAAENLANEVENAQNIISPNKIQGLQQVANLDQMTVTPINLSAVPQLKPFNSRGNR